MRRFSIRCSSSAGSAAGRSAASTESSAPSSISSMSSRPASRRPRRPSTASANGICMGNSLVAPGAEHHGRVRIGVGVSTAPDAQQAAVEAAAQARDQLAGDAPSLAVLFGSRSHTDNAVDIVNAVQEMVEPPALIGCIAQAVAGGNEIENEPAVAVWLASGLSAETFQLDFVQTGSGGLLTGYRFDTTAHDLHLLLPDPYTFPANLLIDHLNADLPGTTVVGGAVSGGLRPGDTRLFHDRNVLTSGLVGARLPGTHGVTIVSQGCRPIGDPYIVTGAEGTVITELGGRPPLQRLREIVEELPLHEQELVSHGLQIGILVDERLADPGQGDFLIRGLLGADPSTGAME